MLVYNDSCYSKPLINWNNNVTDQVQTLLFRAATIWNLRTLTLHTIRLLTSWNVMVIDQIQDCPELSCLKFCGQGGEKHWFSTLHYNSIKENALQRVSAKFVLKLLMMWQKKLCLKDTGNSKFCKRVHEQLYSLVMNRCFTDMTKNNKIELVTMETFNFAKAKQKPSGLFINKLLD